MIPFLSLQDGGEATFNQIAALLERMERVKDQWQARGAGASAASGPSPPSMSGPERGSAPSLPASALTSAASGSVPAMAAPAATAAPLAPSASPAQSHASEDMWRQTSGLGSNLGEKERKKKRKEGKESKEAKDPSGDQGRGSEDGFPDSFGAWPDSGEAAFPDSFGAWGAPLGPSPAFEASNWATAAEGPNPGPCASGASGASASGPSPFAAFGSLPEPAQQGQGGQGGQGPNGLNGPNIAPTPSLSEKEANAQGEGTLKASLHVSFPFAAIDKEAFERLFVRAAAQAAGVAPRRIRVQAVRPGPGY